jgi:hypothetical protein
MVLTKGEIAISDNNIDINSFIVMFRSFLGGPPPTENTIDDCYDFLQKF